MRSGIQLNPGNIHARLGAVLAMREQAIYIKDLEATADCQDEIADYLSVYMEKDEWEDYEAMPGFAYGDGRSRQQVMRDLRARLRYLFKCAKAHNVFSRHEVEQGDASDLDDIIQAEAA